MNEYWYVHRILQIHVFVECNFVKRKGHSSYVKTKEKSVIQPTKHYGIPKSKVLVPVHFSQSPSMDFTT